MRGTGTWCAILLLAAAIARSAAAQTMPAPDAATATAPANVEVSLSTDVEEGKKQLIATVKRDGKPVEKATVSFGARRTFGRLVLGSDTTLDDGTAAIPFPSSLPGDAEGNLTLDAVVTGPLSQSGARTEATMPGGTPLAPPGDPYPRALWAPAAPLGLIAVIAALLGGAWGSYLFVIVQLRTIYKGVPK